MPDSDPNTLPTRFTIRVYGLLIAEGQILLSKENVFGSIVTKFPGGGLEFGEGIADCLQREFAEELQIGLTDWKLFHLNEDFIPSAFDSSAQVVSIYYKSTTDQLQQIQLSDPQEEASLQSHGDQILFWTSIRNLNPSSLPLPIDRQVVKKLQAQ